MPVLMKFSIFESKSSTPIARGTVDTVSFSDSPSVRDVLIHGDSLSVRLLSSHNSLFNFSSTSLEEFISLVVAFNFRIVFSPICSSK